MRSNTANNIATHDHVTRDLRHIRVRQVEQQAHRIAFVYAYTAHRYTDAPCSVLDARRNEGEEPTVHFICQHASVNPFRFATLMKKGYEKDG